MTKLTEIMGGKPPDAEAATFVGPAVSPRTINREPEARVSRTIMECREFTPFQEAALLDVVRLAHYKRPVGYGTLLRDMKAILMAVTHGGTGRDVRGAVLQLAASCIAWAAALEREPLSVTLDDRQLAA